MSLPTANQSIVGTCSICSGPVCVPTAYHSIVPPTPKCNDCGATAKRNYGPVVPMDIVSPVRTWPSHIAVDTAGRRMYEFEADIDKRVTFTYGEWAINEQQSGNSR